MSTRHIAVVLAAVAATAVIGGAACARTSPCDTLPPPTAEEVRLAEQGRDIEQDVDGTECEVEGNRWVEDDPDGGGALFRPSSRTTTATSSRLPRPSTAKTTPKATTRPTRTT